MFELLVSSALAGPVRFEGEGHAQHPVWSNDGRFLAFEVNKYAGGDIDLYIASVTGDVAKDGIRVTLPGGASPFGGTGQVVVNPVWHPKEGMAVFEGSNQGGQFRIYYRQATGGAAFELIQTTELPGDLTFPSISPDGKTAAFVSDATGAGDIRLRDTQTGRLTQLTTSPVSEMFPLFSADGSLMLFTRKNDGGQDVYEIPVAGGAETQVVGGSGDQTRAAYGAGDSVVYFDGNRGEEHWDLVSMNGEGTRKVLAKDVRLPVRARPALSPDGLWAAFTYSDPTKDRKIVLTRIDGSRTVDVDTEFTACGEPALSVQGGRTLLAFTALPSSGSDWRFLTVMDVTDRIQ